jgi:hypothetical protein
VAAQLTFSHAGLVNVDHFENFDTSKNTNANKNKMMHSALPIAPITKPATRNITQALSQSFHSLLTVFFITFPIYLIFSDVLVFE